MTALLLALVLLQANSAPTGFATGVVRSLNGPPAAGVRVFAVRAGDPNNVSKDSTVFESLAQTDAAGRYKLELPAGRYYIGAGSVSSPTYYPDSASIAAAKAISISAGTTVENVDFSRYTAAPLQSVTGILPPGSTGVLSGVIRNFDGSVASGITVIAVPVSAMNSTANGNPVTYSLITSSAVINGAFTSSNIVAARLGNGGVLATTDNSGHYRMEAVSPGTYNLVAGYSDLPVFYPEATDVKKAVPITTTPTTVLTNLDFTLRRPAVTYSVTGRVTTNQGRAVGGTTLAIQGGSSGLQGIGSSLLPSSVYPKVTSATDGTFEFVNIPPGRYSVQAQLSGTNPKTAAVVVTDRSVSLDFDFPIQVLTGRVVWDDGSAFTESSLSDVVLSTTSNPNMVLSSVLSVSKDGVFSGVMEPGEYRFYFRSLPDVYEVRSITSDGVDLTKEHLVISPEAPPAIEIRVAKRSGSGARVQGKILDATTRGVLSTGRVELCCFSSGPIERLSAELQSDGSFDFPGVPAGRYSAELKGKSGPSTPTIVNSEVVVDDQDISGLVLLNSARLNWVDASVMIEGSGALRSPLAGLAVSLTLPTLLQGMQVGDLTYRMSGLPGGAFAAPIPTGWLFNVSVSTLPKGYRVKSIITTNTTTQIVLEKIPDQ